MSNTIRSKFKCSGVTTTDSGLDNQGVSMKSQNVSMYPVYGGSEENKVFNKATPVGKIEINIAGDAPAFDKFIPGKEYFVDFTVAE